MFRWGATLLVVLQTRRAIVGALASAATDICTMDQHCMNGGSCESANEEVDHRHCICAKDYSGTRCSHFCPLQCQNGGYCTLKPRGGALGVQEQTPTFNAEDYMCKCFGHYAGESCEIPYNNCGDNTRCYHGGECIQRDSKEYSSDQPCRCQPGFGGPSCDTRISPAVKNDIEVVNGMRKSGKWMLTLFMLAAGVVIARFWHRRRRDKKHSTFDGFDEELDENITAFMANPIINTTTGHRSESKYSDRGVVELHLT